jgi:hypothetical protein
LIQSALIYRELKKAAKIVGPAIWDDEQWRKQKAGSSPGRR